VTGGEALLRWSIRAAFVLYAAALAGWLRRRPRLAGWCWSLGCLTYLAHVAVAFHFYHGWSHAAAYRDTARLASEMIGVDWGGGLYLNYAFTAAWAADVLSRRRLTASRWRIPLHAFLAFMWINATVVFGRGWMRWLGVAAAAGLAILGLTRPKAAR